VSAVSGRTRGDRRKQCLEDFDPHRPAPRALSDHNHKSSTQPAPMANRATPHEMPSRTRSLSGALPDHARRAGPSGMIVMRYAIQDACRIP
jgi:hypothetical protein